MISRSLPVPQLSRSLIGITFFLVILFCASSVSASTFAPIAEQTVNPGRIVLQPTFTLAPVTLVTATPTATQAVQTISCTAPAECLYESEAATKWGADGFSQAAELPCYYNAAMVAAPTTKYCYKQKPLNLVLVTTLVPVAIATQITAETYVTPVETATLSSIVRKPTINIIEKTTISLDPCAGKVQCNGVCTDTMGSDTNNCGGCGWVCPGALICSQGECIADCKEGFDNCQQYDCTDLRSDDDNCGKCGNTCSNRQTCVSGKCTSLCSVTPSTLNYFSWADWKGVNWMTPVKDQGACGSCWAEAPTGAAEALYNIENDYRYPYGYNLNLSEQALTSACYGDLGSCTGGDHGEALKVLKSQGVAEEVFLPYQSQSCAHDDGNGHLACNADITGHCSNPTTCTLGTVPQNRIWKIQSYFKATDDYAWTNGEEIATIKEAILCHGPLTACSGNWWHCVDIVGWQGSEYDANGGWIVRNSWGTGWLSNGYGVLKYGSPLSTNKDEQLLGDIAMDAWYVQGVYHG
jgi:C1A family cysteine protease